jgi:ankyrin repeat and BTB/POZ domain-containing protein 1
MVIKPKEASPTIERNSEFEDTTDQIPHEHPLDLSEQFDAFCMACRRGDLKACQEFISAGVNINGKDRFDYTPLVLVGSGGPDV